MERPIRERTRHGPMATPLPANDFEPIRIPADAESCAPGPNMDSAAVETIEDPDTLRLRQVLAMRTEGRTQKEIAEHFGKDTRTIRRWMIEAKQLKLKLFEYLTPEEALADYLYSFGAQKLDLLRLKKTAQEAGDHRLVLRCLKELTRLEVTRMAVLEKLGLFTRITFAQSIPDPAAAGTQALIEGIDRFLLAGAEAIADGEDPVENDGDGEDPIDDGDEPII